jgi:hypothetical protein
MTGKIEHVEVITSVQRRRRWSTEDKAAIVQEPPRSRAKGAVYVGNQLYRGPWCQRKSKWANPYKSRDGDRHQVSREISQSW